MYGNTHQSPPVPLPVPLTVDSNPVVLSIPPDVFSSTPASSRDSSVSGLENSTLLVHSRQVPVPEKDSLCPLKCQYKRQYQGYF